MNTREIHAIFATVMPKCSPKLRELRLQAELSQAKLAAEAGIDPGTVGSAERGAEISDLSLVRIINTLGGKLGREIKREEVVLANPPRRKRRPR